MDFKKICKPFHDLTPIDLYAIIKLRIEVFIIEQNCIFQDLDDKDQECYHLMFYKDGSLEAYSRLLPAGLSYPEMSIGRVITSKRVRGTGAGKQLMEESIDLCYQYFGKGPIKIGAQLYAKKFYEQVGFQQSGPVYLEDGIEHITMTKQ
ncbi:GNAT family N-acetyltransferase [Chryseosolibacter indicus]|uniref:GNAT family N-acetyltransferase n=1 Tax=Chryseosolibacter indicus TaxID=2782351 RepID=A0ABS5VVL0_9BACT|nr:GNAT family N-acetyltransferase [Chryseosolibacter indicus]MBT1705083.1 GNAT family N-acetyltransferase [Chryseosolibacter indicus]